MITLFGYNIKLASTVKRSLISSVEKAKDEGEPINKYTFWIVCGIYHSRMFGLCIYKSDADSKGSELDKITDEYIEAIKLNPII